MTASFSKPTRIGAYDIVDVIGRGGMGTVYKATDPRIGRSVAIKVLIAAADDPDLLARFYREAKYTGSLQHHNIVTVYELGHQDGVPYLVMEYLEGVSLDVVIASGRPMPIAEKLRIILQVCSGLSYAHRRDLVHRDIKPANVVILENGTAKLVDFGIARLGGNGMTRTGQVVGSLNYMSPEQLDSRMEVDLRTDVYSAGVVLYQLLTGVLPFEGGGTAATLMKIVHEPPPPMRKYLKDCPPDLETIVQKALAKNREDRYASADDFALDISRVQQQFERRMLGEYLQQAENSLKRKDFDSAKQMVLQVLRAAPQNTEAGDMLRLINKGQGDQQRRLQAQQCNLKAEAAFREWDLSGAQALVEEGLKFDSANSALMSLKVAIEKAQAKAATWQTAIRRAEAALNSDKLEAASQSLENARAIQPDDPACQALTSQIAAQIEDRWRELEDARQEKLHDQEAVRKQRELAFSLNAIEKVMADARMLLSLGRAQESLESLKKINGDVSQLPARWQEQFDALRKEAQAKVNEQIRVSSEWDQPTQESRDLSKPTVALHPRSADAFRSEIPDRDLSSAYSSRSTPPTYLRIIDRGERPVRSGRLRPVLWAGIAAAILAIVVASLILLPTKARVSGGKQPAVGPATYTYAEINAEPWGTLEEITPANGDAQSAIGSATPLRVKLPPGKYTFTLAGPNHETKQVNLAVPSKGGAACLVLFRKPDIKKLLSQK